MASMSRSFLDADVNEVLKHLTIDEKILLLSAPNWWNTNAIERLEVPAVRMSDGPNVCKVLLESFLRCGSAKELNGLSF